MWKALSAIAIFTSLSIPAKAQQSLQMLCAPLVEGLEVMKKWEELPVFAGRSTNSDNVYSTIFYNKETKTFTVTIIKRNEELYCALFTGKDGEFLGPKSN